MKRTRLVLLTVSAILAIANANWWNWLTNSGKNDESAEDNDGHKLLKVAVLSSYFPMKCGIATYAQHLRDSMIASFDPRRDRFDKIKIDVIAVSADPVPNFPSAVKFVIRKHVEEDYRFAAQYIAKNNYDVLLIQHEFGLFGGTQGMYLNSLLEEMRYLPTKIQLVTHTVEPDMDFEKTIIFKTLLSHIDEAVTLSEPMCPILRMYRVDVPCRLIPHGVSHLLPDSSDVIINRKRAAKQSLGFKSTDILLTVAGLIRPGKGLEPTLTALPDLIKVNANIKFVVVGDASLTIINGERYNDTLLQLTEELGITSHVIFVRQFQTDEGLQNYLLASDVYLAPYKYLGQASSGMVPLAMAAGCVVVASPFLHASALLSSGAGVLIGAAEPTYLKVAILQLLQDTSRLQSISLAAVQKAKGFSWEEVGRLHVESLYLSQINPKRTAMPSDSNNPNNPSQVAVFEDRNFYAMKADNLVVSFRRQSGHNIRVHVLRGNEILSQNVFVFAGCFLRFSVQILLPNGEKQLLDVSHRIGTRVRSVQLKEGSRVIAFQEILPLSELIPDGSKRLFATPFRAAFVDLHIVLRIQGNTLIHKATVELLGVSQQPQLQLASRHSSETNQIKQGYWLQNVQLVTGMEYLSISLLPIVHKRNKILLGIVQTADLNEEKARKHHATKVVQEKFQGGKYTPGRGECIDYVLVGTSETAASPDWLKWHPMVETNTTRTSSNNIGCNAEMQQPMLHIQRLKNDVNYVYFEHSLPQLTNRNKVVVRQALIFGRAD